MIVPDLVKSVENGKKKHTMNQRIRELYQQASFDSSVDSEESMVEKFAQLIVKECAEICLEANDHKNILQYFGVEEQTPSQKMADAGCTRRPKGWTKEDEE